MIRHRREVQSELSPAWKLVQCRLVVKLQLNIFRASGRDSSGVVARKETSMNKRGARVGAHLGHITNQFSSRYKPTEVREIADPPGEPRNAGGNR